MKFYLRRVENLTAVMVVGHHCRPTAARNEPINQRHSRRAPSCRKADIKARYQDVPLRMSQV